MRSLQAYLFTVLRCRIADLARARGPTAGAVPIGPGTESSAGIELPSAESTPSTYARQDEARSVRDDVLSDVLEGFIGRLRDERRFRDLSVLELIFCRGVSQQDAARLVGTSEPTVSRTRTSTLENLRELVRKHPSADALEDLTWGDDVEGLIRRVWEENGLTTFSRTTLGEYALGVLDEDEAAWVRFRLEILRCECCNAHLEALIHREEEGLSRKAQDSIYASTRGYFK